MIFGFEHALVRTAHLPTLSHMGSLASTGAVSTLKPRYNESLYNEFPDITNKITKTKSSPWQKFVK